MWCGRKASSFRISFLIFSDNIGYIRYSIKAEIVKPWKLNNRTKMVFTVLDVLDLNGVSDALVIHYI